MSKGVYPFCINFFVGKYGFFRYRCIYTRFQKQKKKSYFQLSSNPITHAGSRPRSCCLLIAVSDSSFKLPRLERLFGRVYLTRWFGRLSESVHFSCTTVKSVTPNKCLKEENPGPKVSPFYICMVKVGYIYEIMFHISICGLKHFQSPNKN